MFQPAIKEEKITVSDYLTWPDEERWEIINGIAYNMSPAPRIRHQDIAGNFFVKLKTNPDNTCFTGIAPMDVILDDFNVIQPDVLLVCDRDKITEKNINGAPDLVIEVISPSTGLKDRREKKNLYERFGVKEYIIVFPESDYVEVYALNDQGNFNPFKLINWDETLHLQTLDIKLNLWEIFDRDAPESKDASKETKGQ